jgi:phosphotransferase system enzyme I (PtsI)
LERRIKGSVVSDGLAKGEALLVATGEVRVPKTVVTEAQVDREISRLDRALRETIQDVEELSVELKGRIGDMAEIIGTYLAFLQDEHGLIKPIKDLIRKERFAAPYAVFHQFTALAQTLKTMPEPLPSRIPDLIDIKRRLIGHLGLKGTPVDLRSLPRRVIIVADDLTPSQTAVLDREKVVAFVTDMGGPASHTAILARHLGIPAVVGLGDVTRQVRSGDTILVDGLAGEVVVDPSAETMRSFQGRMRRQTMKTRNIYLPDPLKTRDGVEVHILGNIDRIEQGQDLTKLGVKGVGLFRTEFLFLGRHDAPDEESQVDLYRRLLSTMAPHPVHIRTMDFGADKWDHRLGENHEPNPFLGLRAIRLSFAHADLFKSQLRAILRASPAGNPRILFPMIMDAAEMRRALGYLHAVASELREADIPIKADIPVGAMVEVPSAALGINALLRTCDFVNLGTNDLTQYTLAIDRTNPLVAKHFAPHHPAVLQLLRDTVRRADSLRKQVVACGEMAGSEEFAPVLLGLGVRCLSMAAPRVAGVAERVASLRVQDCESVVERMLNADGADEARAILLDALRFRRG